jgi:hypothetical protein
VGLRTGEEGDDRKWGEKGRGGKRQDRDQQGDDKKKGKIKRLYMYVVYNALLRFLFCFCFKGPL